MDNTNIKDAILCIRQYCAGNELCDGCPALDDSGECMFCETAPHSWQVLPVKSDSVNRPAHYCRGGLECIEVIKAELTPEQYIGYLYGNVTKYLWRYQYKNGLEDLKKAAHYLRWLQEAYAEAGEKNEDD